MIEVSALPGLADNRFNYNSQAWVQQPVVTAAGRQWAAWWDDRQHPIVAVRTLPDGDWVTRDLHDLPGNPLASPVADDGHNALSIGRDADGLIHVAGNMHLDPMRYARTTTDDIFGGWTSSGRPGSDLDSLTYPKFVNGPDGLLWLMYRDGGSGHGDEILETFDGDWSGPTTLLDGRSSGESPYLQRIVATATEVHVAAVWRETTDPTTNQDVTHMVWRGGVWETMDGTPLTLPVTHSTIGMVVDTATDVGLVGSCGMDVDDDNNPHITVHIHEGSASRVLYAWWQNGWNDALVKGNWQHQMPLPRDDTIAPPHVVAVGSRIVVLTRNDVDEPDQVRLSEITGGQDGDSGSVLDVDLFASRLPNTIDGDVVRLLATPTESPDHPDADELDFSTQPLALVTINLASDLDAILSGTATVPSSLESTSQTSPGRSAATIQRRVTWLGCEATTGKIISELPDLTGIVSRALGAETSTLCATPIPLAGQGALGPAAFSATEPKRTMVVAVVNDIPVWAGLVLRRDGGTSSQLQLACVTPEGYLARRKVRDHTFVQVDEANIMSGLAEDAEDIGGTGRGLGLIHEVALTGRLRDRTYEADDKASVLQRMKELSRVIDGPEWTIDPEWNDDKTRVLLVLRVADRIGVASASPDAVFQATFATEGSSAATYTLSEDYTDSRGANWVVAYSTGEGDDRPESSPQVDQDQLAAGTPIFEHHFSPGSDISVDTLEDHAAAELARLRTGTQGLRITSRWDRYPRLGVDYRLGDDVAWDLIGHRHPDGFTGSGRLIGWELDLESGVLSPTLVGVN